MSKHHFFTGNSNWVRLAKQGTIAIMLSVATICSQAGALEDYVAKPDPTYNWKRTESKKVKDATLVHLEMVSQTWRGMFWSHHLQVVKPDVVRNPDIALIFVTGDGEGGKDIERIADVAYRSGAIVAASTVEPAARFVILSPPILMPVPLIVGPPVTAMLVRPVSAGLSASAI